MNSRRRSKSILSEVLALLRSGHADGALSRWRTLHEIAAIAIFIAERGQDVAERYLLHEFIESYRAAEEYQKHCARLGQTPFDLAEMEKFKQEYDRLQSRYGDSYLENTVGRATRCARMIHRFADA